MLVSGANVTNVIRSAGPPEAGLLQQVSQQLNSMPPVRVTVRRWPAEVRHTVVAMDVPGVTNGRKQRSGRAAGDRDICAAGDVEHFQGVADDVIHARVASNTGDGAKLTSG